MMRRRTTARQWLRPACVVASMLLAGCTPDRARLPQAAQPAPASRGKTGQWYFEAYCAACHQPDGRGTQGGPPPLAGSPWVAGPETRLIRIVLQGLRGPITVGGTTYNLEMPSFGPAIPDGELAALLTYARRRFGGPQEPIAPETVAAIRAATRRRTTLWTVEALREIR